MIPSRVKRTKPIALREPTPAHPCPYTHAVLDVMAEMVRAECLHRGDRALRIIDPCAGTGLRLMDHPIFDEHHFYGLELEESFISPRAYWVQPGDMTATQFEGDYFDVYMTSFVFPNRMTDSFVSSESNLWDYNTYSHKARENRKNRTYKLNPNNTGAMKWGAEYQATHRQAIAEGIRILRPNGLFIIEMKNFYQKGSLVECAEWFASEFEAQGCTNAGDVAVPVKGNRKGANGDLRATHATVQQWRTPS